MDVMLWAQMTSLDWLHNHPVGSWLRSWVDFVAEKRGDWLRNRSEVMRNHLLARVFLAA